MLRILHLTSDDRESHPRQGEAAAARGLGADIELMFERIGHGGDHRNLPAAAGALRRRLARLDVVHAFGLRALAAAAMGARGLKAIFYTPAQPTLPREIGWVRAISSVRRVEVLCPTATMRRRYIERGVPLRYCHLLRPSVDFSSVRGRKDAALRSRLGIAPNDVVLFAPGQSTRPARQALALWTVSILHVLDERYRLLIEGTGDRVEALRRFAMRLGQKRALVVARDFAGDLSAGDLPAAADAAICTSADGAAIEPICLCMAAGMPIISTVTPTAAEVLEDRHNALLVSDDSPRRLARRALDLFEDAQLRWRIADAARAEAFEFFSPSHAAHQQRTAYEQAAAGAEVRIPEAPPGAGSRFMGRV